MTLCHPRHNFGFIPLHYREDGYKYWNKYLPSEVIQIATWTYLNYGKILQDLRKLNFDVGHPVVLSALIKSLIYTLLLLLINSLSHYL
jgi:hypothetical protein